MVTDLWNVSLYIVSVCTDILAKNSWKSRRSRERPVDNVCCRKEDPAGRLGEITDRNILKDPHLWMNLENASGGTGLMTSRRKNLECFLAPGNLLDLNFASRVKVYLHGFI